MLGQPLPPTQPPLSHVTRGPLPRDQTDQVRPSLLLRPAPGRGPGAAVESGTRRSESRPILIYVFSYQISAGHGVACSGEGVGSSGTHVRAALACTLLVGGGIGKGGGRGGVRKRGWIERGRRGEECELVVVAAYSRSVLGIA